jgi:hypothetical protein
MARPGFKIWGRKRGKNINVKGAKLGTPAAGGKVAKIWNRREYLIWREKERERDREVKR